MTTAAAGRADLAVSGVANIGFESAAVLVLYPAGMAALVAW